MLAFLAALWLGAQFTAATPASPDTYTATDALGRRLPLGGEPDVPAPAPERKVGIFYFLWHGEHGKEGPFDISRIINRYPDAARNPARWGGHGVYHWWGEPLFGYYTNRDAWVMRKHIELLTDAGIDFVVFDTTNGPTYRESALLFLKLLNEYAAQNFKVPQVAFYTHTASGETINTLYREIYQAHAEYAPLWFRIDGKPMIIGHAADPGLAPECKAFFRIKQSQWPNEYDLAGRFIHHRDGFPWISFEEKSHLFDAIKPSVISVSVAQHNGTIKFSSSALYGDRSNRTRSWHDGANDPAPDAFSRGYNFEREFSYAIRQQPDLIFITGWNEWIAGNWGTGKGPEPVVFVDCCDVNNSRDIEPMKGGYGDNYYLQMAGWIRRYRGAARPVADHEFRTIDFARGFRDWETAASRYADYAGDTAPRDAAGYGELRYRNSTGRNDFVRSAAATDRDHLYFLIETREPLKLPAGERGMYLLLRTAAGGVYPYLLDCRSGENDSRLYAETSTGEYRETARCRSMTADNRMQIAIPRSALGLKPDQAFDLEFKWSDNQQDLTKGIDFDAFYTDGDAAPGGRMNYLYRFRPAPVK